LLRYRFWYSYYRVRVKGYNMLENFSEKKFQFDDGEIYYQIGGTGPPLLMIHGYPQTHYMWNLVAPTLAKKYTIILPDLRGYGKSLAPTGDIDHFNYSKRVMGLDLKTLMSSLNFKKFSIVGHDRGGRVAHRMARDYKNDILNLIILDICPTLDMYEQTDMEFAKAYFHWFFLIQPVGIPETLIGENPKFWLNNCLNKWSTGHDFSERLEEYSKHFSKPENIHGSCEDYRAGASIDLIHDKQDRHAKLSIPIHTLWGAKGFIGKAYDPIKVWQSYTKGRVSGKSIDCGHFIPEEKPNETINEIINFLESINYN